MNKFAPLDSQVHHTTQYVSNPPTVNEHSIYRKLASLNPTKASAPDNIPAWLLKENADILAPVVTDTLNCSFSEARLPQSWKHADITPIPIKTPVRDVNKHLRPISLTPILFKLAEEIVVDRFVKPAVLKQIDPRQFGTVPGSSTTEALTSMTHSWIKATVWRKRGNCQSCSFWLQESLRPHRPSHFSQQITCVRHTWGGFIMDHWLSHRSKAESES